MNVNLENSKKSSKLFGKMVGHLFKDMFRKRELAFQPCYYIRGKNSYKCGNLVRTTKYIFLSLMIAKLTVS